MEITNVMKKTITPKLILKNKKTNLHLQHYLFFKYENTE
jgi:hypothetical protein